MDPETLRALWEREEEIAHVRGWDFSHIDAHCREGALPWSYEEEVKSRLREGDLLLDVDTGGGEQLLSFGHPPRLTAATEGWPPNVELCRRTLTPLGVRFEPCSDVSRLPFADASFTVVTDRHGDLCAPEFFRVLKPGGVFITQQVGEDNDRDLVEMVLPGTPKPFPGENLTEVRRRFEEAGFVILRAEECFRPIRFDDVGAFVWFARVLPWEFPDFSVERCFPALLRMQEKLEREGMVEGTVHRFLLTAQKPF